MRAFLFDRRGAILPPVLVMMAAIILMGALAVNVVRIENKRTVTQSVLDICVLNAAAQRQTLAPRTVLDDCLAKHGFDATLTQFEAQTGREKSVTASAETTVESLFLAEPELYSVAVSSSASETQTNLEIVLALDVSASMTLSAGGDTKLPLQYMQEAATQFVTQMLQDDTSGRVSITLVPYGTNVNLGADVAAKLSLVNLPATYSFGSDISQMRCVNLSDTIYASTAISPTTPYAAMPFVDPTSSTRQTNSLVPTNPIEMRNGFVWPSLTATGTSSATQSDTTSFALPNVTATQCPLWRVAASAANSIVRLPDFTAAGQQGTVDTVAERTARLASAISNLVVSGETSINVAMRWALAFLDPAMRPVFATFVSEGRMPESARDRPLDFDDPSAIKVIVVLSDGTNFEETRLKPQYERGPSPFFIGSDGNLSWLNTSRPGTSQYWVPHRDSGRGMWQSTAWTVTGTARRLDYEELWRMVKLTYVAWQFHARSASTTNSARVAAYTSALNEYRTTITTTTKNSQQTQACAQAAARGIKVYTIGYQTATTNFAGLQACATESSYFYEATSAGLQQAFAAIALHITRLSLDQ